MLKNDLDFFKLIKKVTTKKYDSILLVKKQYFYISIFYILKNNNF